MARGVIMKDKEAKNKPLYSMPSNVLFMMKKAWQIDKILIIVSAIRIPVTVLMPLMATYLSKYVVELVSEGSSPEKLTAYVLCFSGAILLLHLLNNYVGTKIEFRSFSNRFLYMNLCNEKILDSYNSLQSISLDLCDLREFLDLPDHFNRGKGPELPTDAPEIIFENVSFRYPKSEKDALKNINIKIKPGEKIALVGLNGAGKTTLVKLLCGLYRPTRGHITVGNHRISEYNRDNYYKLSSVVFQDIHLMPISIAKNIALCKEKLIDWEYLGKVLKLSGLYDKVQSLPKKEHTLLLKSIYDDATDLSGGEKQKLALARALYKGGKIIILDEPTAALDPIAENEMYLKYNELTSDATSVFVSHRLSSTRFCDRILFMENGEIVEEGTHDELMKLNGKYANMFNIQSHYYKEAMSNEAI